jgi:hypothetical protein
MLAYQTRVDGSLFHPRTETTITTNKEEVADLLAV